MNRFTRFITLLLVFGCIGLPLVADSMDQPAGRKWHFQISAFGGFESGARFIHHFRLYSDREMALWYNNDNVSEAWDTADAAFVPGAALGIGYDLSRVVSVYARFSYVLTAKFHDGVEETLQTLDISDTETYGKFVTYPQTSRKAQAFGGSVGAVLSPFLRIPVGLDIELGLWGYNQEFLSATCQKYDQEAAITMLETRNVIDGRDVGEYQGRGKWKESHLCLMVGLGLKYYPIQCVSVDLNWRTLGYLKDDSSDIVFQDNGQGGRRSKWYTVASLWTAGVSFYF